jgi:hypothetical protein
MNTTAATAAIAIAGMSTTRRPYESDTWPARSRLAVTPAA